MRSRPLHGCARGWPAGGRRPGCAPGAVRSRRSPGRTHRAVERPRAPVATAAPAPARRPRTRPARTRPAPPGRATSRPPRSAVVRAARRRHTARVSRRPSPVCPGTGWSPGARGRRQHAGRCSRPLGPSAARPPARCLRPRCAIRACGRPARAEYAHVHGRSAGRVRRESS